METDWSLKHPVDLLSSKKGVCHDLTSFQSTYLQGMGFNADHLMFIIYKPEGVIRFHHSLIWIFCNEKYFILEPCADYADNDCYGPYDSLDEYEALLMWRYEKTYSTPDYEWFNCFYKHSYQYGMNLQEYLDSWS